MLRSAGNDRDYRSYAHALSLKRRGALQLKGSPGIQVILISDYYGILRVLTIRTMTAMIRMAPIAITAQSSAGGMELLVLGWVKVIDVTGWVMVMTVEVAGGIVITGPVVAVVVTGAASVVKKKVDQPLVTVPLVARTLHQYWVLYFNCSLKGVALVGQVAE